MSWTIHVQCTMLPTTNSQYIISFVCSVQHLYFTLIIKSVLQDLPKLILLIQDSFHKFRSFTLLDLELEHTLQKHCPGGTCYTNLHFKVTSICLINDIRSNSSHTVVFAGTFLVTFPQPIRFCPCLFLHTQKFGLLDDPPHVISLVQMPLHLRLL